MKTWVIAFLMVAGVLDNTALAQNLKPQKAVSIDIDLPPLNLDYIGNTRIYIPVTYDPYNVRGFFMQQVNNRVYTFVNSLSECDMYITFAMNRVTKKFDTPTSSSSTTTDKAGNKITTTTYRYEGEEEIELICTLSLASGVTLKTYSDKNKVKYSGSSLKGYESALLDYENNKQKKVSSASDFLVSVIYTRMSGDYLIANRTIDLYAMGAKSRKQDYSDINTAGELLTNWFATNPVDALGPDVVRALQIYDEALIEFEPKDKKARVNKEIAALCYYQKACVEFYLKNYRKAEELILQSESLDKHLHFSQENLKDLVKLLRERKVFN